MNTAHNAAPMSPRACARLTIRIHDGNHQEARAYCLERATSPTMLDQYRQGWQHAAHLVRACEARAERRAAR